MLLSKLNETSIFAKYKSYNWDITLRVLRAYPTSVVPKPTNGLHYEEKIISLNDKAISELKKYGCDFSALPIYLVGDEGTVTIVKQI